MVRCPPMDEVAKPSRTKDAGAFISPGQGRMAVPSPPIPAVRADRAGATYLLPASSAEPTSRSHLDRSTISSTP